MMTFEDRKDKPEGSGGSPQDDSSAFSGGGGDFVRAECSLSLAAGDSHSEKSEASGSTSGCSSLGGPERESAATPEPRARRHDWSHTRDCGVMANLPSSRGPERLHGGNGHGESRLSRRSFGHAGRRCGARNASRAGAFSILCRPQHKRNCLRFSVDKYVERERGGGECVPRLFWRLPGVS